MWSCRYHKRIYAHASLITWPSTIVSEVDCTLVERPFHLGDTVKRSPLRFDDGMSGVVLERKSELQLRHVISDAPLPSAEYVPEDEVELATEINLGGLSVVIMLFSVVV